MNKYRLVIWDIDGTLLDTHKGVSTALRYALKQFNISKTEAEIMAMVHTPKIKEAFIEIAGMDESVAEQATDIFRTRYKEADLFKASVYEGILDVLETIKARGIPQAIATNKRQDYATEICYHFGLDRYCHPIVGGDRYNQRTKADLIQDCLNELSLVPSPEIVFIGDMPADREAAQTVGIDFIGVNYGFGFRNGAEYANSPEEILKKLDENT